MTDKLKIVQTKSRYGRLQSHKDCLIGLGLRRIGHSVVVEDTPAVRGMVRKIQYMVQVKEV
jgi:large subunit ribosomal protein L30